MATGTIKNPNAVNNASALTTISPITITPTIGSNHASYGGSFYYKVGSLVFVHIGVKGLTASANNAIFTLPAGYRPYNQVCFAGECGLSYTGRSAMVINGGGDIQVQSPDQYANIDAVYLAVN